MDTDFQQEPSDHNSDVTYTLLKAISGMAAGAIPVAGPVAHELFWSIFSSPAEKRQRRAFLLVESAIKEILDRLDNLTPQALSENEEFITIMMEAMRMAVRTSSEEKLLAIKNAIVNSVIQIKLEEYKKLIFLKYIDDFTSQHLLVFEYVACDQYEVRDTELGLLIKEKFTSENLSYSFYFQDREEGEIANLIAKELYTIGLFRVNPFHAKSLMLYESKRISDGSSIQELKGFRDAYLYEYELSRIGLEFLYYIVNQAN